MSYISYLRSIAVSFAFFALLACNQLEKAKEIKTEKKVSSDKLISCEGIGEVKVTYSHADLVKKFGDKVIKEHENTSTGKYSSLWENTPEQINVYWKETSAPFKTIKFIETSFPGSPYLTADSIGLGQDLHELVRRNGGLAVKFRNINQTNSPGLITSFNNGDISKHNPCLVGIVEQAGIHVVHTDEMKAFRKKEEVNSYDDLLNRMDFELAAIRIVRK